MFALNTSPGNPMRRLSLLMLAAVALLVIGAAPQPSNNGDEATTEQSSPDNGAANTTASSGRPARAVPAYRQANHVAVLTIRGVIDKITLRSLERRVAEAKAAGAGAIVLDIDTPGGEMYATLDICNLIKTDAPANTVAWINDQAFSAGTFIALACREIVVKSNATFGDAAPIKAAPGGLGMMQMSATERAKIEAPLLAEVVDSARRNGYDENLVQAFVSVGIELWMLENKQSGNRIFVNQQEYETVFGEAPPKKITSVTPPSQPKQQQKDKVLSFFERLSQSKSDSEEEPPTPEEIQQQVESQQIRQPTRERLTAEDAGKWTLIGQVIANDRLLTLKANEALYYGLATATVNDNQDIKAYFGAQKISHYHENWSEALVRFCRNPIVMGVLIAIFLIGMFGELAAPGFGVFGAVSLAALLLLVGAPALLGMAQWWTLAAILIGLLLIGVELFVIPGFGVTGVLGALVLLTGLVGTFVTGDITTISGQSELWTGVMTTLAALFAAIIGIWILSKQMRTVPIFNRVVMKGEVSGTSSRSEQTEGAPESLIGAMAKTTSQHGLQVGDVGTATTDLRPAGRADFNGRIKDVQTVGSFIEQGMPVRIVNVGRYTIDVEEAEA